VGPTTMHMTGSGGILSVPSEHLPGLIALVLLPPVLWVSLWALRSLAARHVPWAASVVRRFDALCFTAKVALFATLVGALVHAAIIPTHWGDERVTAVLFIVDTVGFALAFGWTLADRRHWRLVDLAMLGGTAAFYALYILKGWETADPVGLITTTIELAAALVLLSPAPVAFGAAAGPERWITVAAVPLALLSLLGTTAIAGVAAAATVTASTGSPPSTPSPDGTTTSPPTTTRPTTTPSMPGMAGGGSGSTATGGKATTLSLATTSPAGPIQWPDDMAAMAPGMAMATPNCVATPTASQQTAAVTLVDQTVAAVAPYTSLAAAKAAGYVPLTPTGQKIVHYINPSIYRQGHLLDPAAIPVLVYVNTPHGAVLSAAMYLMPRTAGTPPPQPGGCLTQWHIHTDLCFSGGTVVGNDNAGSCATGVNQVTEPMMHVWVTPVSGGPLAPDPSAVSEVESADAVPVRDPPNPTA
jgi:hypothetical protein